MPRNKGRKAQPKKHVIEASGHEELEEKFNNTSVLTEKPIMSVPLEVSVCGVYDLDSQRPITTE